ncbi:hypothetical protein B0T20DRAFT_477555 [Sordaria brevicollis]|uniref:Uncharacterized protein n=1 Tax=Sordaria brevicollis TaxID=83679 RepID=A0AAE0UDR7_SORBR|nr:hypothetical protein B0T20DRAFT_477555 [Sordaria brevicollis]
MSSPQQHEAHNEQAKQSHIPSTTCPGPFPHPAQPTASTADSAVQAEVTTGTQPQNQTPRVPGPFPPPPHAVIRKARIQVYVTSVPIGNGIPRPRGKERLDSLRQPRWPFFSTASRAQMTLPVSVSTPQRFRTC